MIANFELQSNVIFDSIYCHLTEKLKKYITLHEWEHEAKPQIRRYYNIPSGINSQKTIKHYSRLDNLSVEFVEGVDLSTDSSVVLVPEISSHISKLLAVTRDSGVSDSDVSSVSTVAARNS